VNDITRGLQVLALPLNPDCRWSGARLGSTVQDYLLALLTHLLIDRTGDNVSEYGMVGESDWQYDLYHPLATAGLIPAWEDGWGLGQRPGDRQHHPEDRANADQLITDAIAALPYVGQAQR
jgi:hypothetical protein